MLMLDALAFFHTVRVINLGKCLSKCDWMDVLACLNDFEVEDEFREGNTIRRRCNISDTPITAL